MGRFVISNHLNVALRGEFLRSHVAGAVIQNLDQGEVTAMVGLPVGKNFELRPEFRVDFASENVWGGGTSAPKGNAMTGTLAALTYF